MSLKPESQYIQGLCVVCKSNKQMSKGVCKKGINIGKKIYRNCCLKCSLKNNPERLEKNKKRIALKNRPWFIYKKDYCENCKFIPIHTCQLDVDHIDGNKNNNDPSNYRTLCANCHRLKTFLNKDWEIKI